MHLFKIDVFFRFPYIYIILYILYRTYFYLNYLKANINIYRDILAHTVDIQKQTVSSYTCVWLCENIQYKI